MALQVCWMYVTLQGNFLVSHEWEMWCFVNENAQKNVDLRDFCDDMKVSNTMLCAGMNTPKVS